MRVKGAAVFAGSHAPLVRFAHLSPLKVGLSRRQSFPESAPPVGELPEGLRGQLATLHSCRTPPPTALRATSAPPSGLRPSPPRGERPKRRSTRKRVLRLRRGRDLNPRGGSTPPTRLAGERLRPLGHLSRMTGGYQGTPPALSESGFLTSGGSADIGNTDLRRTLWQYLSR